MSQIIHLVKGDTGPDTVLTLTDRLTGLPIDLTTFTSAILRFRPKGSTAAAVQISAIAVFGTATLGVLKVTWGTTLQNLTVLGAYEGELEMVFTGPKTITAYRLIQFYVRDQFA